MRISSGWIVLLAMLTMPLTSYGAETGLRVKIDTGKIEGKESGQARAFLGIPFAAAPVGDLRWKPPMPAAKWKGVRKATEFGSRCMQGDVFGDMTFRDAGNSEDCLFLNVWTPANVSSKAAATKLPVMVWVYGGGFVAGATSEQRQDGSILAQQGVVVVSMNYRLGIFGFFVHPELAKESGRNSAGNYGLLDQAAALEWVHKNISAFGGDPANVTIFGESAGSFSVSALMASPTTKGLFEKAIGESGGAFSRKGLSFAPLAEREERDVKAVSEGLGVQTLAELRALPAQKLLDFSFKSESHDDFRFTPCIDGYFLPESVPAIFAAGKQNDVPLLAGWNHDEGSFSLETAKPTAESFKALAEKDFGGKAPEFLRLYPAETEAQAYRSAEDYAGDSFIVYSSWKWIEAQATTGKHPVYHYRFDFGPTDEKSGMRVAFHSGEIEYVFGQLDSRPHVEWKPEDRQLSEQIQKYWTNFARSGDPNGEGLPKWPVYSSADGWQVMHLDANSEAHKDDERDRYLFLTTVWDK